MLNRKYVIYIGAMVMPDKNAEAQRAYALSKSIKDIGYTPIIIGLDYSVPRKQNILATKTIYHDIDCYAIQYPVTVFDWLKRMVDITKFVKVMKRYNIAKIHSIIVTDFEAIALQRLKKFCNKNNIYIIADNIEWYEKSNSTFPKNVVKNLDTYIRMNLLYPNIKNMICISRYLYNYYKNQNNIKNIVMIPVTVDKLDQKWKELPEYFPNTVFTFVYAGNPGDFCIKERLDWLIKAICRANQQGFACRLIIIGVDQQRFENQYKWLSTLEEYHNITYLGKLSHLECLSEIRRADMFSIVREDRLITRAGFPTKLAEGLACGTPVLTTPSGNIREFVSEGVVGFVTKGFEYKDVEELIFKVVQLKKEKRTELHNNCNQYELLDYHNFNLELKQFFDKLQGRE